jgi:hypothetical protein
VRFSATTYHIFESAGCGHLRDRCAVARHCAQYVQETGSHAHNVALIIMAVTAAPGFSPLPGGALNHAFAGAPNSRS